LSLRQFAWFSTLCTRLALTMAKPWEIDSTVRRVVITLEELRAVVTLEGAGTWAETIILEEAMTEDTMMEVAVQVPDVVALEVAVGFGPVWALEAFWATCLVETEGMVGMDMATEGTTNQIMAEVGVDFQVEDPMEEVEVLDFHPEALVVVPEQLQVSEELVEDEQKQDRPLPNLPLFSL